MNLRRMDRLVAVMLQASAQKSLFDMSSWIELDYEGENPCGTVCCAAGYAALDPVLQAEGLRLAATDDVTDLIVRFIFSTDEFVEETLQGRETSVVPMFNQLESFDALAAFFEISLQDTDFLFDPATYIDFRRVTPLDVVERIKFLIKMDALISTQAKVLVGAD